MDTHPAANTTNDCERALRGTLAKQAAKLALSTASARDIENALWRANQESDCPNKISNQEIKYLADNNWKNRLTQPLAFSTATELDPENVKAPEYIADVLFPRGRVAVLVAGSTTGKTPFTYQIAREIVLGHDILGLYKCRPELRVGIVDSESPQEDIEYRIAQQDNVKPLGEARERLLTMNRDQVAEAKLDLSAQGIGRLAQYVRDNKIDLLILDNLWMLSAGSLLKPDEVKALLRTLRQKITTLPHKPTVWLLHHPKKDSNTKGERITILDEDLMAWFEKASGSMVLINLTDVRLGLERHEIDGEEYTILRGRSRVPGGDQNIGPLYLNVDEEKSWAKVNAPAGVITRLPGKRKDIAKRLQAWREFSIEQAYGLVGEFKAGVSKRTIKRTIQDVMGMGLLQKTGSGTYAWTEPPLLAEARSDTRNEAVQE